MASAVAPTPAAKDPAKEARKWKKELSLSKKREKDWESDAEKIIKRYRGEEKKRNRYNVLWANTEILRPAIYNSRPNPDVRRRFRDSDPIGKAVSNILERSLSVFVDGDETDDSLKNDVLDGLLVGRGLSRIRYVPTISEVRKETEDDDSTGDELPGAEPDEGETEDEPDEELENESVCTEHVDWRDFRHGYGRVWPEVPWCGFRHKLSRADAVEKFGEEQIGRVKFTVPTTDDPKKPGDEVGETQKVAEFWEIWDKLGNKVFFVQDDLDHLLFPLDNDNGAPPLDFDGFFPCPRPLYIVENTSSLLPIPLFHLYQEQANELDKLSGRIDKIVNTCRLRGVYDARIAEFADLLSSDDNEMVPVQNAQQWADGGLDKAVSWMPVDKNVAILEALYDARERQKAIIDELLGISDIMRGATDPTETATSQQLKSNYGNVRLQRMQKEVQRYARDLLRLAASAMAQKFSPATFEEMTELKFPTVAQKAAMVAQFQQQAMQQAMAARPPIQPPPPGAGPGPGPTPAVGAAGVPHAPNPPGAPGASPAPGPVAAPPSPPMDPGMLKVPTWEDILGVMRSDKMRQYKIDVETDSTVASTLSSDMQGMSQVLTSISQTMQELAPMVQQGVLPVDAAKELIMAVIRRSRLGIAVEDAFDKLQAPKPPPDPHAAKAASDAQNVQVKANADIHVAEMKAQLDAHLAQVQQQAQAQQNAQEQAIEEQRSQREQAFKTMEAKLDAFVKIVVATISATKQPDQSSVVADRTIAGGAIQ